MAQGRGGLDGREGACPLRGKSGLHKATVPGNARAGQLDGQRHREQTARRTEGAPMDIPEVCRRRLRRVRVKRWGKSPPGDWQQDPHGKPHREQRRIGTPRGIDPYGDITAGPLQPRGPGWQLEPRSNAWPRGMAISGRATCRRQNPAYRPSAQFILCSAVDLGGAIGKRRVL